MVPLLGDQLLATTVPHILYDEAGGRVRPFYRNNASSHPISADAPMTVSLEQSPIISFFVPLYRKTCVLFSSGSQNPPVMFPKAQSTDLLHSHDQTHEELFS